MPQPAQDVDLVQLELHPGAAPEAQPAPREGGGDVAAGHLDARRQAFEDGDEGGSVGLSGRQPPQVCHASILPPGAAAPVSRPAVGR